MKVIVPVTHLHIYKGLRGQPGECPLAYALKDAGFVNAGVGLNSIRSWPDGDVFLCELPWPAQMFIMLFDSGSEVRPFMMVLDIPNYLVPDSLKPILVENYPVRQEAVCE